MFGAGTLAQITAYYLRRHAQTIALLLALVSVAPFSHSQNLPGLVEGNFPADAVPAPCVDINLPIGRPVEGAQLAVYGDECSTGCRFRSHFLSDMTCPSIPVRPEGASGTPLYDDPFDNTGGMLAPKDPDSAQTPSWRNDGNACCMQYTYSWRGKPITTTGYGSCSQGVCKPFLAPSPTALPTSVSTPSPSSSGNQSPPQNTGQGRCRPNLAIAPNTINFIRGAEDSLQATLENAAHCTPSQLQSSAIFWRRGSIEGTESVILGRGERYQLTSRDTSGTYFAELRISTGSGVTWIRSTNSATVTIPSPGAIKLTKDIRDLYADEGTYVAFAPSFSGLGSPGEITWYFLPLNAKTPQQVATGATYEIRSVFPTHRGTYFAVAKNSNGQLATSRARLFITPSGTGFGKPASSSDIMQDGATGVISWNGEELLHNGSTEFDSILKSTTANAIELVLYNPRATPLTAKVTIQGDFALSVFGQQVDFATRPAPTPSATPAVPRQQLGWSANLAPGTGVSILVSPKGAKVGENKGVFTVELGTERRIHNLVVQVQPIPGRLEYFAQGDLAPLMRGGVMNIGVIPATQRDLRIKVYIRNSGGLLIERPSLRIDGDGVSVTCDQRTSLMPNAASECTITVERGRSQSNTAKLLTTESSPELSTITWREEEE